MAARACDKLQNKFPSNRKVYVSTFSPTLVPDNKGRVSSDLFTPHPGRRLDKSSVADGQLWTGLTGGVTVANIDLCEAT